MKNTPSPSRLPLDTSPPEGGEDKPAATSAPILSPHEVGERCRGEAETERGNNAKPSRSRRKLGTTERARSLRWVENSAEGVLWQELKAKRLGGYHFTRQFPIGPYFADFACRKSKLVVEIDGSQHAGSAHERNRDEFIQAQGYSTLRFWNTDVLKHRRSVCETILAALECRLTKKVDAFDLRYRPAISQNNAPAAEKLTLDQPAHRLPLSESIHANPDLTP